MQVKISKSAQAVADKLKEGVSEFDATIQFQLFRALSLLEPAIIQNIRTNSGLNVRTGALMNSVGASKKVYKDGNNWVGSIGTQGIPYARIQEKGGTIVPKNGKALTIPMPENRNRDGSPKITIQDLHNGLLKSFVNKGIIFGIIGKGRKGQTAEAIALFALKSSVTLPARPYLTPAFESTRETILKEFGLMLKTRFGDKE